MHLNRFSGREPSTHQCSTGFRLVEKYGMLVGGIDGHRHDLSSMIMLKDNHIWSSGESSHMFAIFPLIALP